MTNRAKQKGTLYESALVTYLNDNGYPNVERKAQQGAFDKGDLSNLPNTVVEAKALGKITLASAVDEMLKEQANAQARWGVVFFKRARKSTGAGYAVMTIEQWVALRRAAGD